VDGAIAAQAGVNNIKARDLYLANTQGDIGSAAQAMNLQLSGALRQAGSAGDLYLRHSGGNLRVGSVAAGGTLSLINDGDILGYDANHFLQGAGIALDAGGGDLGSSAARLNVKLSGADQLTVKSANGWLDVRDTTRFALGRVVVGQQFDLNSVGAMDLDGDITSGSLRLELVGTQDDDGAPRIDVTEKPTKGAADLPRTPAASTAGGGALQATASDIGVGEGNTTD